MRKLSVFNHVTLDGYFAGEGGDMRWAHQGADDPEFREFTASNAKGDGVMVFGRVTYDMMAGWWPTDAARKAFPEVADRMNAGTKIVFSRTMERADWQGTTLVKDDIVEAMRRMKAESGADMVIMGSGMIVSQMAQAGLIDFFQVVVNPLALGRGRTMFEGVEQRIPLKLTGTRAFQNGKVLLTYERG